MTLDVCIAIYEFKVIETDHLFVSMPSRKDEFGAYHDIVHPIGGVARHILESAIINAYKEYISAHETSESEDFTALSKKSFVYYEKTRLFGFMYVKITVSNWCTLL